MIKVEEYLIGQIRSAVTRSIHNCPPEILSGIYLEVPREKGFGDFSTNIAMRLARIRKKPPREIAEDITSNIEKRDLLEDIKIEKPGFINFFVSRKAITRALRDILKKGANFGSSNEGRRKKIQIEFVSANPTGPLTVAHGRQAAIGDSLARIFEFCGYKVTREYYINDEGIQIELLAQSVKARIRELRGEKVEFPSDGYKGSYIYDIARDALKLQLQGDEYLKNYALNWILEKIKKDLEDFGVKFDVWYSQRKLSMEGKIEKILSFMEKRGFLYKKDNATWFRSTEFGDDKDRVVIKKDGTYTYLVPDIAYHMEKFKKYNRIINIWGPDHHGYLRRLKAACLAMGVEKKRLSILIAQLVTLYRDKKPVAMSTREGEFITLRELIDEVGRDAGRFFFIMRRTDSHLDFDLELAKSKSLDNPVYYIQYGHARIASVIKYSGLRLNRIQKMILGDAELNVLDKDREIDIIKQLMHYPNIISSSARNLEPYILLSYLQELATLFHSYYDTYRIVTHDKKLTSARVALIAAVKSVLMSGLNLLGVGAPEKM